MAATLNDPLQSHQLVEASVLALEAGRTVIIDREEAIAQANKAGISIVGRAISGSPVTQSVVSSSP